MNYTELETAIQDYCQNGETTFVAHINEFIKAAEDRVFTAMGGPHLYKSSAAVQTAASTRDYTLVEGTIDVLGIRLCETAGGTIVDTGPVRYLLRKDRDFMFEAYPGTAAGDEEGIPRFYSVDGASVSNSNPTLSVKFFPTPDALYEFEVEYYGKSTTDSITSGNTPGGAGTTETWLSVTAPDTLVYGSLVQAYIFMKGEADVQANYEKKFEEGLLFIKNLVDSKQNTDTYSDQGKSPASQ